MQPPYPTPWIPLKERSPESVIIDTSCPSPGQKGFHVAFECGCWEHVINTFASDVLRKTNWNKLPCFKPAVLSEWDQGFPSHTQMLPTCSQDVTLTCAVHHRAVLLHIDSQTTVATWASYKSIVGARIYEQALLLGKLNNGQRSFVRKLFVFCMLKVFK